jgi:hypothetical protein
MRCIGIVLAVAALISFTTEGLMAESVDLGNGFMDHGVGVPISNHRGIVATVNGEGEPVALAWLRDHRGNYSLLMVNALTGEYEQFTTPRIGDDPFASVLSSKNRFYTHYGSVFMEFDPTVPGFTFHADTERQMAMSMTEGDDGTIWSATYPNSGVVSYNPETGEFRDYGHLYAQNWAQYPRAIATDDQGWVYFNVTSTASQIIILNPETGEATPVIPEDERLRPGSPSVTRHEDGKVYARNGEQWYQLYAGEATKIDGPPEVPAKPYIASTQGLFHRDFGNGYRLNSLDLVNRVMTVTTPEGETVTHEFDYESEGAHTMAIGVASDGTVAGGTAFPMRFFSYNPETDEMIDRTALGQWNTIAPTDTLFYIGAYTHGLLQAWDPSKEWTGTDRENPESNPRFLAEAGNVINRPHDLFAHPDGHTVIMAGTPGYGLTGGGLLFYDMETGEETLLTHEQLIPQQSVHSIAALPDGNLLCGSTINAGTGGEVKATLAELFVLDMETKQITWQEPLFETARSYQDLYLAANGLIYGIVDSNRMFVLDPATCGLVHDVNFGAEFGPTVGGQGPRMLIEGPDDRLLLLLQRGFAEVDLESHEIKMLIESPVPLSVGGDYLDGRVYFSRGSHIYSGPLPAAE